MMYEPRTDEDRESWEIFKRTGVLITNGKSDPAIYVACTHACVIHALPQTICATVPGKAACHVRVETYSQRPAMTIAERSGLEVAFRNVGDVYEVSQPRDGVGVDWVVEVPADRAAALVSDILAILGIEPIAMSA